MISGRILPVQALRRAAEEGRIRAEAPIPRPNFQPASLDLRFGEVAYRLRASFLAHKTKVATRVADHAIDELPLHGGLILEPRRPYLIPLREGLALGPKERAYVNPKSSAGRVDTLCRVITDYSDRFDEIDEEYAGPMYVEVVSRTFPLRIEPDMTLVQLRLFCGEDGPLNEVELQQLQDRVGLVRNRSRSKPLEAPLLEEGIGLSLDLSGDENGVVGYRAKRNSPMLDYGQRDQDWRRYWEQVYRDPDAKRLVLEPEEFYLLLSQEAVSVPPEVGAEMVPYDVRTGELRTHYAGFFDPGFGYRAGHRFGSRATLEVRAHDVPFVVEDGQRVCRLAYSRMDQAPDFLYGAEIASNYQQQIATLSKHFTRPESRPRSGQLPLFR